MALFDWLGKKKVSDSVDPGIIKNQIATDYSDGAIEVENAVSEFILNFDWVADDQVDLINKYREIANYNEVDFAIEDIINEMVSFSEDEDPVKLNLDETELSDNIKAMIHERWEHICNILELRDTIHSRARNFYIDGRLAYQKVVDKNRPKAGLLNVIELDTRYVTKFRNIIHNSETKTISDIKEYFVYNENKDSKKTEQATRVNGKQFKEALKLSKESITYVTTGLTDPLSGYAIGWLHKAIVPANQLRMMENALVIYRITRAPERRVFYVDTGNLPKSKAEQYLQKLQSSYRNRMQYDPESGSFKDNRHLMTMQEDFWLPRTGGGRGTEISTIGGSNSNLGEVDDVMYFLRRLYKALNIPVSRIEPDGMMSLGGRSAEISRDELKFSKFVSKVRKRFNIMMRDLLRTDLILTKIVTDKEWQSIEHKIGFIYAQDMYLEERKFFEMTRDRIELAKDMADYVGKYFSNDYIRSQILQQTDEEKIEQDKLIEQESKDPKYQTNEPEGF